MEGGMSNKMSILLQCLAQTVTGYTLAILTNWLLSLIVFLTLPLMMVSLAVTSRVIATNYIT